MDTPSDPAFIAFDGDRRIAAGDLREVARAAKQALDRDRDISVLIFNDFTSHAVDLDFRGSVDDVLARLPVVEKISDAEPAPPANRGPGRPKLGVVAREITLLPRHWEWLAQQAGGASLDPVSVEITYGVERIMMALQGVDHFTKIAYAPGISYGEAFGPDPRIYSVHHAGRHVADARQHRQLPGRVQAGKPARCRTPAQPWILGQRRP